MITHLVLEEYNSLPTTQATNMVLQMRPDPKKHKSPREHVLPVELVQVLNVAKQDCIILRRHFAGNRVSDLSHVLHVPLVCKINTNQLQSLQYNEM